MKKITLISACMLLFTVANAEQMQFVTTMSAPVGNFAHLDAADSTHVTGAPILNFCNTRSNVGNIVIKGANAYLKQVNVQNGTTLGSTNTPEYRLSEKLTVEDGGTVNAGRVMANNVTFKDTNFHQSNVTGTVYGNDITVMGGKADNMDISGTARINKSAQNTANLGEELWWDNQYASDYDASGNKKTNGKTYTSFLLKSKNTLCQPPDGESSTQNCPDGQSGTQTRTWDTNTCAWSDWSDTCTKTWKPVLKTCNGVFDFGPGHLTVPSAKFLCFEKGYLVNQQCPVWRDGGDILLSKTDTSTQGMFACGAYGTTEQKMCAQCKGSKTCRSRCYTNSYELVSKVMDVDSAVSKGAYTNAKGCCSSNPPGFQTGDHLLIKSNRNACYKLNPIVEYSVKYYACE